MITLKGKPVFSGISRGYLCFYHRHEITVSKLKVSNPELEYQKYLLAKKETINELECLYQQACDDVGENDAQIFCIHQMILCDSQFEDIVKEYIIDKHYNSDYAVARAALSFSKMLEQTGTDYVKERVADVKDVSDRLIRHIQNRKQDTLRTYEQCIICADDLMPSETVGLDRTKVVSFCTRYGSANSHTAILSRTMNIPSLIGMGEELNDEYDGKYAIVDGYSGVLYIEPDKETTKMLEQKEAVEGRKKELLRRLRGRKNITRDGREISVYANIASLSDVSSAIENDAGGVGLFRSEFMYLGRNDFPDEDYLFYNYRRVIEDMKGKPVVIRTLDIGADKQADYFHLKKETNPALGMRAIRICLTKTDIFKTQLRALFRASVYGNLRILIPFIIDAQEIVQVKKIIDEVKEELIEDHIPFKDDVMIGAMIETPAAVMTSDLIAREVDFFSIGTNDLEQYTLAIDRQSSMFEIVAPQNKTALLRMIKTVCDNAHANGIRVGICGEIAGDLNLTEVFLDMHVDALSVAPARILPVRKTIRSLNLSDRRRIHENLQHALKY